MRFNTALAAMMEFVNGGAPFLQHCELATLTAGHAMLPGLCCTPAALLQCNLVCPCCACACGGIGRSVPCPTPASRPAPLRPVVQLTSGRAPGRGRHWSPSSCCWLRMRLTWVSRAAAAGAEAPERQRGTQQKHGIERSLPATAV